MPGLQGDSCRRGRVVLAPVTMLAEGLRSLTGLSSLPLGACSMGSGWGVGVLHEGLSTTRPCTVQVAAVGAHSLTVVQ